MSQQIQAAYTVVIGMDGSITTEIVDAGDAVLRKATTFDIYQTSKELVSDIESQILADRVARSVVAALQPQDPSAELKSKVINALNNRGIETPTVE